MFSSCLVPLVWDNMLALDLCMGDRLPCPGLTDRDLLYSEVIDELQIVIDDHSACDLFIEGDFNVD